MANINRPDFQYHGKHSIYFFNKIDDTQATIIKRQVSSRVGDQGTIRHENRDFRREVQTLISQGSRPRVNAGNATFGVRPVEPPTRIQNIISVLRSGIVRKFNPTAGLPLSYSWPICRLDLVNGLTYASLGGSTHECIVLSHGRLIVWPSPLENADGNITIDVHDRLGRKITQIENIFRTNNALPIKKLYKISEQEFLVIGSLLTSNEGTTAKAVVYKIKSRNELTEGQENDNQALTFRDDRSLLRVEIVGGDEGKVFFSNDEKSILILGINDVILVDDRPIVGDNHMKLYSYPPEGRPNNLRPVHIGDGKWVLCSNDHRLGILNPRVDQGEHLFCLEHNVNGLRSVQFEGGFIRLSTENHAESYVSDLQAPEGFFPRFLQAPIGSNQEILCGFRNTTTNTQLILTRSDVGSHIYKTTQQQDRFEACRINLQAAEILDNGWVVMLDNQILSIVNILEGDIPIKQFPDKVTAFSKLANNCIGVELENGNVQIYRIHHYVNCTHIELLRSISTEHLQDRQPVEFEPKIDRLTNGVQGFLPTSSRIFESPSGLLIKRAQAEHVSIPWKDLLAYNPQNRNRLDSRVKNLQSIFLKICATNYAVDNFIDSVSHEIMDDPRSLPCGHTSDVTTLQNWEEQTCPLCRAEYEEIPNTSYQLRDAIRQHLDDLVLNCNIPVQNLDTEEAKRHVSRGLDKEFRGNSQNAENSYRTALNYDTSSEIYSPIAEYFKRKSVHHGRVALSYLLEKQLKEGKYLDAIQTLKCCGEAQPEDDIYVLDTIKFAVAEIKFCLGLYEEAKQDYLDSRQANHLDTAEQKICLTRLAEIEPYSLDRYRELSLFILRNGDLVIHNGIRLSTHILLWGAQKSSQIEHETACRLYEEAINTDRRNFGIFQPFLQFLIQQNRELYAIDRLLGYVGELPMHRATPLPRFGNPVQLPPMNQLPTFHPARPPELIMRIHEMRRRRLNIEVNTNLPTIGDNPNNGGAFNNPDRAPLILPNM